jgi:hypothetical protein
MSHFKLVLLSFCLFVAAIDGTKLLEIETKTTDEIDAGMIWPSGKVRYVIF